ncbi:carotenoid biosynthesis protein [Halobacillus yeomjeoni]|uniref:Carotenoid biosynthesis protein n=1 Tax=Halobacillus yeomjeoni TaxID=311194 RepID=A0A931MU22_9BACI|nr:carotenoid biosynthesis protein [Halobacillus yeomjeoni]MBH0228944.1 carotenoid biosynthesis protein [Halobacillus yeomjeoni]
MTTIIYRFFIFWYICGVILLSFDLLPPWLEWANSVFLITAGLIAAIYFYQIYGLKFGLGYSLLIMVVSIYVEHLGVAYDFLFGSYDYNENFGLKIFDTPITIGFAWLLIIGCSHEIARGITQGMKKYRAFTFLFSGSLLAVTMDLILDPVSYKVKAYWIWQDTGVYYGIPLSNFVGWFVLAALFHLLFILWSPKRSERTHIWMNRMALVFGLIIIMFSILALSGGLIGAVILVLFLTTIWYTLYFWRKKRYAESR